MKRRLLSRLFFILALVAAAGCAGGKVIEVSDTQNGAIIQMNTGQNIVITLESNPTTGYSWELVDYDTALLAVQGESDYKSESNLMGAGGVQIFHLKAQNAGETVVHMMYRRPWEKDVPPIKEFQLNISVQE